MAQAAAAMRRLWATCPLTPPQISWRSEDGGGFQHQVAVEGAGGAPGGAETGAEETPPLTAVCAFQVCLLRPAWSGALRVLDPSAQAGEEDPDSDETVRVFHCFSNPRELHMEGCVLLAVSGMASARTLIGLLPSRRDESAPLDLDQYSVRVPLWAVPAIEALAVASPNESYTLEVRRKCPPTCRRSDATSSPAAVACATPGTVRAGGLGGRRRRGAG
eukprot:scaffold973_cov399-Prasinococcus_capsulatus_cf.AAC.34